LLMSQSSFFLLSATLLCVLGLLSSMTSSQSTAPNINVTKWNYPTGYTFTMYAYAAYCPMDLLANWTCKWCQADKATQTFQVTSVIYNQTENTQVYVGVNPYLQLIIVSFRGTVAESIKNWEEDFDFTFVHPYPSQPDVAVSNGFWKAYSSVSAQVLSATNALLVKYKGYGTVVTGHSLGASLATLAAIDIQPLQDTDVYLWTYGSPRTGNDNFVNYFSTFIPVNRSFRHVNQRDVVPHVPLEILGYHHVYQEIWYWRNQWNQCNDSGEDRACSDTLDDASSVYDHLHYYNLHESCSTSADE